MTDLFTPYDLQQLHLANRAVMAPMTRSRAPDGLATPLMAEYYSQRAGAGLIVTEGTSISVEGTGFLFVPGLYTPEQVESWRPVTSAVHSAGGKIFAQLWHVGRGSHVSLQEGGQAPVSSTDKAADGSVAFAWTEKGKPGFVPASAPRRLETAEVERLTGDFVTAAANAIGAGFDGVEFHGANGYIFEQFINPAVNDRDDRFGSATIESRLRFILETAEAVSSRIGAGRLGIRISPFSTLGGMPRYDDTHETYLELGKRLGDIGIAYIHVIDQSAHRLRPSPEPLTDKLVALMKAWRPSLAKTAIVLAGNQSLESANQLIGDGIIDLAAFGAPYISNPDLVARMRHGVALADSDPTTYYGGDSRGYTDYPVATDAA